MTPVYALFPVSSTGNGMTYEGWSSKSDAFTSLATAGGTSAGIGSSIELLRSTAAQCPETSAVVISSTPAWCDCCVLTFILSIYIWIQYGRDARAPRAHADAGVAAPSFIPCFSREIFTVNGIPSRSPAISAVCARSFAPCWRGLGSGFAAPTAVYFVQVGGCKTGG